MDLTNALWITLIGMGLVFIAILALWGLMALLVRLTTEKADEEGQEAVAQEAVAGEAVAGEAVAGEAVAGEAGAEESAASLVSNAIPEEGLNLDRKRRAAAVAVASALALSQGQRGPARDLRPTGMVSPWQAVHRASQMSQRVQAMKKKVDR